MKFAAACVLLIATGASAQTHVTGMVFNTRGETLGGVRVTLRDSLRTQEYAAVSRDNGDFDIAIPKGVLPARLFVVTDRLGYRAVQDIAVQIRAEDPPFLELELSDEAVPVEPLRVTARKRRAEYLDEFHKRAEQIKKGGGGYLLEREELERGGQQSVARVLATIPGMHYLATRSGSSETVVSTRGNCAPRIYLDGVPMVVNNISMISASSLEGVEVYSGPAGVPAEYFDRAGCGVILLWSLRGAPSGNVHYPIIGLAVIVTVITILLTK